MTSAKAPLGMGARLNVSCRNFASSLGVRTSAATRLFNAASDWAACCVITIRRHRNGVPANGAQTETIAPAPPTVPSKVEQHEFEYRHDRGRKSSNRLSK
jgi:hypothetical protein